MTARIARKIKVFFSYSHKDKDLRDELDKHLSVLKRQKLISNWDDGMIVPGDEWEPQIEYQMDSADLILLLISPDFLDSDYCSVIEQGHALEKHAAGEVLVIPVLLRPLDWQGSPFGKLQGLPTDFRSVTEWGNRDAAWRDVAQGIRKAVEELSDSQPISPNTHKSHKGRNNGNDSRRKAPPLKATPIEEVRKHIRPYAQPNVSAGTTEEALKKLSDSVKAIDVYLKDEHYDQLTVRHVNSAQLALNKIRQHVSSKFPENNKPAWIGLYGGDFIEGLIIGAGIAVVILIVLKILISFLGILSQGSQS